MKTFPGCSRMFGVAFNGTALSLLAFGVFAPSAQATVIFDFRQTEQNFNTYEKTVDGLKLTISDPVATAFPAAGGLNASTNGFCTFAVVGTAGGRCNYLTSELPQGTTFSGFRMSFDSDVRLKSFEVPWLKFVSSPTVEFSSGMLNKSFANFTEGSTLKFKSNFFVAAGTQISVSSSGMPTSRHDDGVFRINNFEVAEVPGPLGVLGIAAGFQYSRKIRRALKSSNYHQS